MNFKKIAVTSAAMTFAIVTGHAVDQSIAAAASFRAAVTLTKNLDMDLTPGATYIDFGASAGNGDYARLATNDTVDFAGGDLSGNTSGQAADVDIGGTATFAVDISCSTTAALSDGTNVLPMDDLQISMNTGDAYGSADYTCAGVGTTPHSHTLDGTDTVLMGGRVEADPSAGSLVAGTYATGSAGGSAVTLRVVYQ